MRIVFELRATKPILPANYNTAIQAIIYKALKFSSEEFSNFLHDIGFCVDGRKYKMFSWALRMSKFSMVTDKIKLIDKRLQLIVSSPLIDDFLKNVVLGSFKMDEFDFDYEGVSNIFKIENIKRLPEPEFKDEMQFKMLSPVIISTKNHKYMSQEYLTYQDDIDIYNRILNKNLTSKYKVIHKKDWEGGKVRLNWFEDYIEESGNKRKMTRLVKIGRKKRGIIYYKGSILPFRIEGPKELIKIGYDCGFGEKNPMGFGLCEVLK